jgi:hypothetical protein
LPPGVADDPHGVVEEARALERAFVLALGGLGMEVSGTRWVLHERLPDERFNFADIGSVSPMRLTATLERTLDHFFQRALRPLLRVAEPVPAPLDAALHRLGFRALPEPLVVLRGTGTPAPTPGALGVRPANREEMDRMVSLWAPQGLRLELRAAVDHAWAHPNPDEELRPLVAGSAGSLTGAAVAYRHGSAAGLVLRQLDGGTPEAGALGPFAFEARHAMAGRRFTLLVEPDDAEPLVPAGYAPVGRLRRYRVVPEAQLEIGPLPPAGPPLWRPPR